VKTKKITLVAEADVAAVLSQELPEQPEIFKEMENQLKKKTLLLQKFLNLF
jgi:hypothetical protein